MKFTKHSKFIAFISNIRVQINLIAILTFLLQLRHFQGEDIVNARVNYLSGSKTDFWGGASTLVYSHVPSIGMKWQIWLALAQIIFTASGLRLFFKRNPDSTVFHVALVALIYSALVLGSQMTRDGLLLSLLILGFGLLQLKSNRKFSRFYISTAFSILILAMSIRPWMSLAVCPLLFYFLVSRKLKIHLALAAVVSFAAMPALVDLGASRVLNLKESYPQQQVMMMDHAATYCYSNNENSIRKARLGLNSFTKDSEYLNHLCEIYRPDTWESLTMAGRAAAKGLETDFWLIQVGESNKYEELQKSWISLIISDPVSYLQNKILFIGKLIIGSDSRKVSLFTNTSPLEKIETAFKLPYEIAITLHLYSILLCFVFLMIFPFRRFLKENKENLILDGTLLSIFLSLLAWSWLSAIAYIGSNGRYSYSISILCLIINLAHLNISEKPRYEE